MDNHKICFIACVNNEKYWQECQLYLSRLVIPEGFQVEVLAIWEATSMCSGYNEGMHASDAKYKIYLHQDVFITDVFFLQELVDLFSLSSKIGMVGLVGSTHMAEDAVMWNAPRISTIYYDRNRDMSGCEQYVAPVPGKIYEMESIDGLLMATSVDVPWREDIFDGWDFYDASHCKEMNRAGFKVVVADYGKPMAVHDDGMVLNLLHYDQYRKVFLEEYGKEMRRRVIR